MKLEIYMQKKSVALALLVFAASSVFPATVSFLVIEAGLPKEGPASQYSVLWENSLMDVFFEAGHIVSNSPIMRLPQRPTGDILDMAERDIEAAKEGGMGFFIIAVVDHPAPHNVSLHLFRISSGELLLEQKYTDRDYRSKKEEQDAVKSNIMIMASRLR